MLLPIKTSPHTLAYKALFHHEILVYFYCFHLSMRGQVVQTIIRASYRGYILTWFQG